MLQRLPLQAIGYDPKDSVLEVAVGGRGLRFPVLLRHFISDPQAISVEESGPLSPMAILVTDASGTNVDSPARGCHRELAAPRPTSHGAPAARGALARWRKRASASCSSARGTSASTSSCSTACSLPSLTDSVVEVYSRVVGPVGSTPVDVDRRASA